ncbi:MAG TPA: PIN domain-containing protein [Thermoanaerobaculia bacterium]|nr:PIN domain-containing protein [Thermoanaerobaculia bacterium]
MSAEAVCIFDSCAVIALLEDEPGAEAVELFLQESNRRLIHAINVCEVYYDMLRRDAYTKAHTLEELLKRVDIEVFDTLPPSLWRAAGDLKADRKRVSLADCVALALTVQEGGALITSDHRDLDPIAEAGICPIRFIR